MCLAMISLSEAPRLRMSTKRNEIRAELLQEPVSGGSRVQHGLSSGEGLADNDHKSALGIDTLEAAIHVDGIDVGEELELTTLSGLGSGGIYGQPSNGQ